MAEDTEEKIDSDTPEEESGHSIGEIIGFSFALLCAFIGLMWLLWQFFGLISWAADLDDRISRLERDNRWDCSEEWNSETRTITVNCE
jgi:hypothetical protein